MTKYQKHWNSKIENLLEELGASEELYSSLAYILSKSELTQVFPNQVINALKAALKIKADKKNIALIAPMQSGKSGTIYVLCNYILPAIGLIERFQSVVFVTSMMDTDLYEQNKQNLEKEFYCPVEERYKSSFIYVVKMTNFFNHPNPEKMVRELNVKLIVRDEDQYGCGQESSFDNAFFSSLRSRMPKIKLFSVSATPYDILDAKLKGAKVEVVEGERPESYFGITEMLDLGLIEDCPVGFKPIIFNPDNEKEEIIHPKLDEYIDHLLSFEDGLGIIRVPNTMSAINARDIINGVHGSSLKCVVIGSNQECDYKIQIGLSEVKRMVLRQQKRVVLIVVHALSAGKDLKALKPRVRFGIESRNKQLANGAQGITGRLCGYHNNISLKILASVPLLKHYSEFEQDWEVFADENWRNQLYNLKVKGLSTQTKFQLNRREGMFTPVDDVLLFTEKDLESPKIRKALSFIDDDNFLKLKNCFKPEFYNSATSLFKLNQKGVTVRVASSYNPVSNRVYKNWGCDVSSDFQTVFFKGWRYDYGILVSNYPVKDERNKIGVCGIKVFKPGEPFLASQETSVLSYSMYAEREEESLDSLIGFLGSRINTVST